MGLPSAGGLDQLDRRPPPCSGRLGAVKPVCAEHEAEIIAPASSAGCRRSVLAHGRRLVVGIPVRGARYGPDGNQAVFRPDGSGESPGGNNEAKAREPLLKRGSAPLE